MSEEPKCRDCRWWVAFPREFLLTGINHVPAGEAGCCQRYPPQILIATEATNGGNCTYARKTTASLNDLATNSKWPVTFAESFCGEFKTKPEAASP